MPATVPTKRHSTMPSGAVPTTLQYPAKLRVKTTKMAPLQIQAGIGPKTLDLLRKTDVRTLHHRAC